ncbi:hypothetical protein X928_01080 [Petrotoga miotherma DSM 10691]|uniref:Uncharacterized protein n=1 Tax=Petrotoga miotherma DSM 10691 TaxID=1434326 RepID=A0A2K1PHE4_9BACT|nr:hypothetical protein [Petrotoga miotherma]PNS02189.1 hypothetical protein X928_01080 [Petrotoga miotherma DSM 10691]
MEKLVEAFSDILYKIKIKDNININKEKMLKNVEFLFLKRYQ